MHFQGQRTGGKPKERGKREGEGIFLNYKKQVSLHLAPKERIPWLQSWWRRTTEDSIQNPEHNNAKCTFWGEKHHPYWCAARYQVTLHSMAITQLLPAFSGTQQSQADFSRTSIARQNIDRQINASTNWANLSEVIEKLLTACWQLSPTFPFSPRTTFIRQCRVRPFRWRPEQWCSISPRQLRMISGLSEKSSISMRR